MASKKVLSIELGVQTTRICEIEVSGKKKVIANTCVFDTPEGTVEDGYVRNKDILAVSIRAAMQKKMMTAKEVIFSISSSKIANREVNMPYLPDSKIADFVKTNAKEYFPIEIEKYVITYKKLEEITDADTKKLRILVLAAPNDLIETYYGLAETMGVQITAIDYAGNSSYQVLKKQNFKGVNVVVQLNETNTLINIMKGSTLLLQRTVPYGVSSVVDAAISCGEFDIIDKNTALDKLLSDTLVNPKLNESAIDEVALSYMDSNNDAYSQQIKQMKAKDMITDSFNYLVNNTIRVLDYYASKFPEEKVSNIYLAGIGSRIKGILPLFKNEVFREIQKIENLSGIDFSKNVGITNEEKSDFIVVAGACLEAVDFVPKKYAEDLKNRQNDAFANKVVLVLSALGVVVFLFYFGTYLAAKATQASNETKIKSYTQVRQLLDNYKAAETTHSNASALYTNTMGFTYVMNVLFEEIEEAMPVGTSLEEFSYTTDSINALVKSSSLQECGAFVMNLKKCTLISEVGIESVKTELTKGGLKYTYDLSITPQTLVYSKFIEEKLTPTEESMLKMFPDKANKEEKTDEVKEDVDKK